MGFLARLILIGAVVYSIVLAIMYTMQRSFQYYPDRSLAGAPAAAGLRDMHEVFVTSDDGFKLQAWYQPPRQADGMVMVYFHGNAGHHAHRSSKIAHFIEAGYGVYLCGYRGYGGNPGRPSEQGFYSDARAGITWLNIQGIKSSQMIFYGESIGSGVAVQMAGEFTPTAVILEAPFTSAVDVARRHYSWLPVDWLLRDRFDNFSKIKSLKTDLLIVHGDEDAVTPIALAQKLFEAAQHPKEFITINRGGHSDLYEHHAGHVILEWLQRRNVQ